MGDTNNTNPADANQTTPPASTPPANEPPAPQPPAPQQTPRPNPVGDGLGQLLSAVNALPDKLAEAVGEKFPVNPRVTQSADESAQTPPAQQPPAQPAKSAPAAKPQGTRFANWFFGNK